MLKSITKTDEGHPDYWSSKELCKRMSKSVVRLELEVAAAGAAMPGSEEESRPGGRPGQ